MYNINKGKIRVTVCSGDLLVLIWSRNYSLIFEFEGPVPWFKDFTTGTSSETLKSNPNYDIFIL
jgi:hypothetical protein